MSEDIQKQKEDNCFNYELELIKYKNEKKRLEKEKSEYNKTYKSLLSEKNKKEAKINFYSIRNKCFLIIFLIISVVIDITLGNMYRCSEDEIVTNEIQKQMDYKKQLNNQLKSKKEQLDMLEKRNMLVVGDDKENNAINDYVATLKRQSEVPIEKVDTDGEEYFHLKNVFKAEKYLIKDSGTNIIYPGAIIKGDSLFGNPEEYTIISQDRTPMVLTSNLINSSPIEIDNVSYDTVVMEGIPKVNSNLNSNEAQPKEWHSKIINYSSTNELKMSLGIDIDGIQIKTAAANDKERGRKIGLGGQLGFNHNDNESFIVIEYSQCYYTIGVKPLEKTTDYFIKGTNLSCLGEYQPAYVSTVDYGRAFYVVVKGKMTQNELDAKVGAVINNLNISAGLSQLCTDKELRVEIYQYGGNAGNLNNILGESSSKKGVLERWDEFWNGSEKEDALLTKINSFIDTTDISMKNAVPLSYKLNYLSDNSAVPIMYIANECNIPVSRAMQVRFSVKGKSKGRLQLDIPASLGFLCTENSIYIEDGKSSNDVVLIWDNSNQQPIIGSFKEKAIKDIKLNELLIDTVNQIEIPKSNIFDSINTLEVYISSNVDM